ncbi:MAG TPA: hypothetical protein VE057_12135 [Archangium sp.]|nr:hypothetical protein [Archangium sp.]
MSSAWNQDGPQFEAPRTSSPQQGVLLAMSDVPAAGGHSPGPAVQGYNVPGRKPDSQMPWEFFMGNASHRLIAFKYGVSHPMSRLYCNNAPIKTIIEEGGLGDTSHLLPDELLIRPDIADVSLRKLFEIKPWHERALQEGRVEARKYLAALNRTIRDGKRFTGGTDFHGEILIRFAKGQYIWRLEWKTSAPGVVQYQWTRSKKPFDSEAAAYRDAQWVDLTVEELRQYGGWVEKAVEGMISRREKLATVSGAVGMMIDLIGGVATTVLWSAIQGQMGSGSGAQQPPAQGGGQVIPFPARPPPTAPPARVPAAAGMSLSP